jgi:uncharacterized repeat protein (TIGR01451 family)
MRTSALAIGLVLLGRTLSAQPFDLSWHTVDGGGVTFSAGGSFVVGATIGQPDAGGPFSGGPFVLHSGFWSLIAGGAATPLADLSVTKTDGQTTAIPGLPVTYTIVVTNAGPAAAAGAMVTDAPPAVLTSVTWTCTASLGSSCPASGAGAINHPVSLLLGGSATFSLTGTVTPAATGTLVNSAAVTPPSGVSDPNIADNTATDNDTLTPRADLALVKSDSIDPVAAGAPLVYTLQVSNLGPSASTGMTVTDTMPAGVTLQSTSPGPPVCLPASSAILCSLPGLAPGVSHTVTITVVVNPATTGSITNTATVVGNETDPAAANDSDSESTQVALRAESELAHGSRFLADLAGTGGAADVDLYRIRQEPLSSYEVVIDATSGDVGAGQGPALERVGPDGSTVLQSSLPVGAGPSRSLRWANTSSVIEDSHYVRVRSQSCGSDCGPDDVYRLRSFETTYTIPRFNNSSTQVTVVIVQNRGNDVVSGRLYFWSAAGTLLHEQPFGLGPRALLSLNTATVAALQGQSGSVTLAADAQYAMLAGKAVALEPATGLSFDSTMEARRR